MELKEYINVVSVCHMYVGTGHELRMGRVPRRFDKRGSKKRSFALICDESLCVIRSRMTTENFLTLILSTAHFLELLYGILLLSIFGFLGHRGLTRWFEKWEPEKKRPWNILSKENTLCFSFAFLLYHFVLFLYLHWWPPYVHIWSMCCGPTKI